MRPALTVSLGHLVALALALSAFGCRDPQLRGATNALRLKPDTVDFGAVFVGDSTELEISVINDGIAPVSPQWNAPDDPFTVLNAPEVLPSGEAQLRIRFAPTTKGQFSQELGVRADNVARVFALLSGTSQPIPDCPVVTCGVATFNRTTERCEVATAADGTACDPANLCIVNATCQTGRCVGTPISCEDGNACTVDVCNALTGCEHLPRPPCPGDGVCNVGVCLPATGCGLAPAEDGTACGSLQTCVTAEVCMSGQCVVRTPPDGYVCAEASPCQGEGRCQSRACVRVSQPNALMLEPTWRFDSMATGDVDAGVPTTWFHDFVLEPTGELTLGNFFNSPMVLRANSPNPIPAPLGPSRRCILWNSRLVCADYPAAPNGHVSELDQSTGSLLWTYDVRAMQPDWAMLTDNIFMARLVVQGSDRLAALFEAYPTGSTTSGNTQCRSYFLVVLDAAGNQVMAQRVVDPLLDVCNHPHPYGLASDSVGNLFIAFSPTHSPQAPLVPDRPMLLMSYTHDGIFRWKLTDYSMQGGELAVARGLLYPENSSVALTAATGQPAFALPEDLGRVVVADARLIPAPMAGANTLHGYEAGIATLRWTHTLPPQVLFWSDQIRLATWHTSRGERTVALTFTEDQTGVVGVPFLHAIDVRDGREAFSCPIDLAGVRTPPQLFEVANHSIGVMAGALDNTGAPGCSKCDPPLAGSAGEFFSFPLTDITVPNEPWVGTFGGATHDHHEDTPIIPPTTN